MNKQNTIPHLLTTLATNYGSLMEAAGCDPYNPDDVNQFIDGLNLATKIKREIMELYSEPPEDDNDFPLDIMERYAEPPEDAPAMEPMLEPAEEPDVYVLNGYANRQEYLDYLAQEHGVDYDTVLNIADALGEAEDFDGLLNAVQSITEE